ncbi:hypothetical protein [Saprospira grandis]|uniref:Uncharacterized protein n=1 Tax=Saprospira grandis (strain Lewin) TaxID=984262 RepID=H6L6D0_SAPGL|nr:hypothetical protein [Saprospira grandis]AFC24072.1 hypothetical protein SGRA_1337 [Saprospira grandis str. Lewin]
MLNLEEKEKSSPLARFIQLLLALIVVSVLIYVVIGFLKQFVWWIVAALSVGVLLINRQLLLRVYNYIKGLYAKNIWLGIGGSLLGLAAFSPFLGFLYLKTLWDFGSSRLLPSKKENKPLDIPFSDIEEVKEEGKDEPPILQ